MTLINERSKLRRMNGIVLQLLEMLKEDVLDSRLFTSNLESIELKHNASKEIIDGSELEFLESLIEKVSDEPFFMEKFQETDKEVILKMSIGERSSITLNAEKVSYNKGSLKVFNLMCY